MPETTLTLSVFGECQMGYVELVLQEHYVGHKRKFFLRLLMLKEETKCESLYKIPNHRLR